MTKNKSELTEGEMKFQALAIAKELHQNIASLSFIDMLAVMAPENPAKKEVQALEAQLGELTNAIGSFIQDHVMDVADAEVGDETEGEPEEDKPDDKPKAKVEESNSFKGLLNTLMNEADDYTDGYKAICSRFGFSLNKKQWAILEKGNKRLEGKFVKRDNTIYFTVYKNKNNITAQFEYNIKDNNEDDLRFMLRGHF